MSATSLIISFCYFIAWIVNIGQPNYGEDNLYSYFIGAAAPGLQPYNVAVRDLDKFKDKYDHGVKQWLKANNFSDPSQVNHPQECVYYKDAQSMF